MRASLATSRSWGARPQYCSGSLLRAVCGRGRFVVFVRWCGFARLSRPRREHAVGGVGARGVRAELRPPLGAAVPSGGGETFPRPGGGWRGGAPPARRPGGGIGGERGGGGAPRFPTPQPLGVGLWPPSQSPFFPGAPPSVYTFSQGCQAALGAGRGLVGRRWVSLAGGGGGRGLSAAVCPPAFPGRAPRRAALSAPRPPCRIPGCHRSVAARGASAELPVGRGHCGSEWAADRGRLSRGCARRRCGVPPLGAAALSGGCEAAASPAGTGRPRAGGGEGGGGGWGGGGVPRNPPLVPWRRPPTAAGGRPGGSGPGGRAADGGGALFPRPPPPFGCQTLLQALAPAPCSPRCRRAVPAGPGGGRASECWGQRFGSAVSS